MRNRTYGGVRGRKTKVGRKLLRFPPTRLERASAHTTRRTDRREESRERGYYDLHRQLYNPLLLHDLPPFSFVTQISRISQIYFLPCKRSHRFPLRSRSIYAASICEINIIRIIRVIIICEICEDLCDLLILSHYRHHRRCRLREP